eukprot:155545_1
MFIVHLLTITTVLGSNPYLKWMGFFDFDPPNQHGWSYGVTFNINDINEAYLKYKMPSMIILPLIYGNVSACDTYADRHPIFYKDSHISKWYLQSNVCPNWSENLKNITTQIQPYVNNKTVIGYFIGDELVCTGVPFSNLSQVIDQIRVTVGNEILIMENECVDSFQPGNDWTWKSIPEGLNYVSADYYDVGNGTHEYEFIRSLYENNIFPMLRKTKYGYSQQVVFVPGTFACNSYSDVMEANSEQIIITLNDMYEWAQNETRIGGFNGWHFDNRSTGNSAFVPKGCQPGNDTLAPGAIAMPNVVAKLKEIGQQIVANNEL